MEKKLRRCPICGCTEHWIVGCHAHRNHVQGPDGRCIADNALQS